MWEIVAAIGGLQSQNAQANWAAQAQGSQQNALAAQYNSQYNQASQLQLSNWAAGHLAEPAAKDCEGCGAPGVRYTHHCEYCKRPR